MKPKQHRLHKNITNSNVEKTDSHLCFFHVALLKFNVANGCHTKNFSLYIIFDLEQRKLLEYTIIHALELNNTCMYMCKSSKGTNNDNKLQDCTISEGKLRQMSQFITMHNQTFSFSLSRNSIAVSGSKMKVKCNQNQNAACTVMTCCYRYQFYKHVLQIQVCPHQALTLAMVNTYPLFPL